MAVIVPFLRIALLFLNVYDTFKVLKLPDRSKRTGERTVQAMTLRKRNMKGCMTVWLVWCVTVVLERLLDRAIGIFMPFYSELKAVVFLFQLLTRSKGAEPIYIHVLRPLIKPYVATLDYSLDVFHVFGDFVILLVTLPYHMFMEWRKPTFEESQPIESQTHISSQTELSTVASATYDSTKAAVDRTHPEVGLRTRTRHALQPSANAVAGPSRAYETRPDIMLSSASDPVIHAHKMWYPPASSLPGEGKSRRVVSDSATASHLTGPPIDEAMVQASPAHDGDDDDWRSYAPFPSAYPPTPQSVNRVISTASSSAGAPSTDIGVVAEEDTEMAEVEEWRQYGPIPSAYPSTPEIKTRSMPILPSTSHASTLDALIETDSSEELDLVLPHGTSVDEDGRLLGRNAEQGSRPRQTAQSLPSRTGQHLRRDEPKYPSVSHRPVRQQRPPSDRRLRSRSRDPTGPRVNAGPGQDFQRVARVAA